jgi:hypothetical protein
MRIAAVAGLALVLANCWSCRCRDRWDSAFRQKQDDTFSSTSKPAPSRSSEQPASSLMGRPTVAGCSELSAPSGGEPIGPRGIDVLKLATESRSGASELIAVWAQNPDSPGGDPHFLIESTKRDDTVQSYVVFSPGLIDASKFRSSPNLGLTLYLMVGRFSVTHPRATSGSLLRPDRRRARH